MERRTSTSASARCGEGRRQLHLHHINARDGTTRGAGAVCAAKRANPIAFSLDAGQPLALSSKGTQKLRTTHRGCCCCCLVLQRPSPLSVCFSHRTNTCAVVVLDCASRKCLSTQLRPHKVYCGNKLKTQPLGIWKVRNRGKPIHSSNIKSGETAVKALSLLPINIQGSSRLEDLSSDSTSLPTPL